MICNICLEELLTNQTSFCCSRFHKKCILDCLRICGNCPICRRDYSFYQNKLKEENNNYTNLEQIRNEIIEDNNIAISSIISSIDCISIDLSTRLNMMEIIINNIETELKNIKIYIYNIN